MKFNCLIAIHTIHRAYSYSYYDDHLSLVHDIFGEEPPIHLYNNDVFRGENLLDKVVIGHCPTGMVQGHSFSGNHYSLHRRRDHRCCLLKEDDLHICITSSKERGRDTIWLLSKQIERRPHTTPINPLKNEASINCPNELPDLICRSSRHRKSIRPGIHYCPRLDDKGDR